MAAYVLVHVLPLRVSPLSQRSAAAVVLAFNTAEVFELKALVAVTVILYCVDAVRLPSVHGELVQLATVDGVEVPYSSL